MDNRLLSLGHGYSARALAARLVPEGWHIVGTTRHEAKMDEIAATGVEPVLWPGTDLEVLIEEFPNMLISAGPSVDGDPVLNALRGVVTSSAASKHWVGYLSTTGVYGNHMGGWVDETTALTPSTKRGAARVQAEADWQSIPDLPLHIFRLAGIYGPGRGPFAKVRAGTARRIIKEGQVFSRIHVEDIASALELSLEAPNAGAIYNLCDDIPAPPQDVIGYAAELLGVPVPEAVPFDAAEMTPMARSFYAESKRVSNKRIKAELGWKPKYPTYQSGLTALLEQSG
ncbi:SDR family oxidoreductase [Sulfitobacter donghicola]|uniref:Epimerase n=1 Tax=Sulfitobacter donghicola DSW-25 = KCTC 12864 = JCM 14565 TaxID=1300350 RepID=A0A073IK91_9RHOB|nr:SDR family oxidoreductase [Sulfitobacter donghicola]KEJ90743.1 epimerase [Sulfitobacter donghicola DSW-25 = KCTC 12864 = JCM 14565]KIN68001.1 NAD-dependent epimerase/dehydratase [Sulfitobacter donghicola DSW-25 = KCTC 12864 = JCM 14565]